MLAKYRALPESIRQYLLVTGNYWAFTLTDGALRMLVVLHFYDLGYTPLAIAMLFLFYEIFGVITNLVGGWLGARLGLNRTMNIGLGLQIVALSMLLLPSAMLVVPWVMAAQALSGIAKDLNKMSAKSAIKTLVPKDAEDKLYRWVAMLTGSKNALKGAGFFLGGVLLTLVGFTGAVAIMATLLCIVWLCSIFNLKADLGKAKSKPKFTEIFSKSRRVNILSAARLFLFAARDVWFVIALPVFLASQLGWEHSSVGAFLALWVIGYGVVQSAAPLITGRNSAKTPDGASATVWAGLLTLVTAILAVVMFTGWTDLQFALITGLMLFGAVFAINSSLHSYLIVSYAGDDGVSLDIGFYYMANAMGRLIGTILSGWVYQIAGLGACLAVSTIFLLLTYIISFKLPRTDPAL
ncbi:MFS transporter [Shewanella sp. Choline-02u-19]|uniref:organoarsenical effux MFS transporter ArsJ n=1 Tax=unclassified Shewanella TaxID=196818 RepID=UPI000C33D35B|nr:MULTISPECIES: organoarsenical effux MFS transporter ArsJ [unclassified Shewanella]PKG55734.1 MFS transporter [Shewanella sp. GutDb-MelDb]PKG74920.1 MFS transporter [Shewanella sp. GutCb]PKH58858.1 MFS transporter [Shewanella sp. Bg11-22]PKI28995.1 MFS transporter [Shewanella sp. Choline-02u-19]